VRSARASKQHCILRSRDAPGFAESIVDNREWMVVYRMAGGFCCMYGGRAVDFEEMLDVQLRAEEMDVRTYFMGM
jgi:hypothetical protein